ncbi:uncharacterized protein LOC124193958 [Daphnia pulex]|uniref:uncharacterized protein LOC124193958 n=1 Tax=Daphnia pulex TaxID=6669 RepID=UPI001EE02B8E|nr:uncharacterized protein LOC124193958 [Daphnia pulex]
MAFVTSKVRLHLLCASVELLISLLLSSMTVATCLGDGKQQWDSKSVWDSTTPTSLAAEMNVTRQILVSPRKPQHLDEMATAHRQIDGPNDGIATEKQPNLNFASRKMIGLANLTSNASLIESNKKPIALPNMMLGTDPSKKSHIIFSAYTEHPTPKNSSVTYTKTNATDGNPVDAPSGVYTALKPGLYGFIFHALTNDLNHVLPTVELRVNGVAAATAAAFNGGTYKALTLIAGARLNRGDHVSVFVVDGPLFHSKKGSNHRASFAGTLMI